MAVTETVRKEALQKIREHISDANICMTTYSILEWSLQTEALSNQWLDDQGNIWFLCLQQKPENNSSDGRMEVFYSNRRKSRFLSLVGEIRWVTFEDTEDQEGFPFARLAQATVNTPLKLAKFFPLEAYCWDEVINDMVPLLLFESAKRRSNKLVA
jgi:hypothetical protein